MYPDREVFLDAFTPERPWDFISTAHYVIIGLGGVVGGPIMMGSLLSIQVATKLGADAIADVMHDVRRLSPEGHDVWTKRVELPLIRIARETMPCLSDGWGLMIGGEDDEF